MSYATNATFDPFYNTSVSSVVAVSEFLYSGLKKIFLPFQQPFYLEGALVGVLFLLILGMNLVERRFWCRYLCLLGAPPRLSEKSGVPKDSTWARGE